MTQLKQLITQDADEPLYVVRYYDPSKVEGQKLRSDGVKYTFKTDPVRVHELPKTLEYDEDSNSAKFKRPSDAKTHELNNISMDSKSYITLKGSDPLYYLSRSVSDVNLSNSNISYDRNSIHNLDAYNSSIRSSDISNEIYDNDNPDNDNPDNNNPKTVVLDSDIQHSKLRNIATINNSDVLQSTVHCDLSDGQKPNHVYDRAIKDSKVINSYLQAYNRSEDVSLTKSYIENVNAAGDVEVSNSNVYSKDKPITVPNTLIVKNSKNVDLTDGIDGMDVTHDTFIDPVVYEDGANISDTVSRLTGKDRDKAFELAKRSDKANYEAYSDQARVVDLHEAIDDAMEERGENLLDDDLEVFSEEPEVENEKNSSNKSKDASSKSKDDEVSL